MNTQKNNTSSVFSTNLAVLAQGSNENGEGNTFYYEHLEGHPEKCYLYKHVNASGEVQYNANGASVGVGWTSNKVEGARGVCDKSGCGCTVISCKETP